MISRFKALQSIQWSGLISAGHILEAISSCRTRLVKETLPWVAIIIRGFLDTPLSFWPPGSPSENLNRTDHAVLDDMSGENDVVLLILPEDQVTVFVAAGAGETFNRL